MRDQQDRAAGGMKIREKIEDQSRVLWIKISGRFVGQQNRWLVKERPADGRTLPFASTQFTGVMMGAMSKSNPVEQRQSLAPTIARRCPIATGQQDIPYQVEIGDQVKHLKDEADPLSSHP